MVDFSKFVNTEDIPNWTARSQGVRMPDWGGLAANLGKTISGAAEAYGAVQGQAAEDFLYKAVGEERVNVGIDFASEEDPSVPADLNNRLERMRIATRAAKKSGMGLSQYFNARINSLARDARANFPGFGPQIDAALIDATGYDFRKEAYTIQKEIDKEQRTEEKEATSRDRTLASSQAFTELYPMITPDQFASMPEGEQKDKLRVGVRNHEAELYKIDTMTKMGFKSRQQYAYLLASDYAKVATAIDSQTTKILSGSTQQMQASAQELLKLKVALQQKFLQRRTQIMSDPNSTLKTEDAVAEENRILQSLDNTIKTLGEGDPSFAMISKSILSLQNQNAQLDAWRRDGKTMSALAVVQDLPKPLVDAVLGKIIESGDADKLVAGLAALIQGSADPIPPTVNNPMASPEQNNMMFRQFWEGTKAAILTGDEQYLTNNISKGVLKKEELAKYANMIEDDPVSFFNFLSDQNVFKAIRKTGNKQLVSAYLDAQNYAFRNNSAIRNDIAVDINKEANKYGSLVLDPKTGGLSFVRDPKKTVGIPRREGVFVFERSVNENLQKVNTFLMNQYNTLKEEEGEEKALAFTQATLAEIGISVQEPQGTQGGTPVGTSEDVSFSLEDGTQITPTSGTTTMAEFLGTDEAVSNLYEDKTNVDTAVKTAWGEGRGESTEGRIAIYEVLRNRALASGRSIDEEAKKGDGSQFNAWKKSDKNYDTVTKFNKDNPEYETYVQEFLTSANSDITNGATHYYNPDQASPPWEKLFVETARIGKHRFGYLRKDDPYRKKLSKYRNKSEFD